jgi:hypothetical protein
MIIVANLAQPARISRACYLCLLPDRRAWKTRDRLRVLRTFSRCLSRFLVSFQITILKVLAGHPEGRVSRADLTRYVSILISSGTDWTNRTKRLAARTPKLNIFGDSFVVRDNNGWQITEGGRQFLASLDLPRSTDSEATQAIETVITKEPRSRANPPLRLVVNNEYPRLDGWDADPSRRSA